MSYEIIFADRVNDESDVDAFIMDLDRRGEAGNERAKGLLKKITFIMGRVEENGTRTPMPWVRHLRGEIWEMRPKRYRILFAVDGDEILVLTYFLKQTERTPPREISRAERVLNRWYEQKG